MRLLLSAALVAGLTVSANAAEIRVLAPGFVYNSALKDLAADFTKKTGVNVVVSEGGMNVIVDQIKTATPAADVIALPADLMNTLYLDGGIMSGSYTPLGRDELGLAVKKGGQEEAGTKPSARAPSDPPRGPSTWQARRAHGRQIELGLHARPV